MRARPTTAAEPLSASRLAIRRLPISHLADGRLPNLKMAAGGLPILNLAAGRLPILNLSAGRLPISGLAAVTLVCLSAVIGLPQPAALHAVEGPVDVSRSVESAISPAIARSSQTMVVWEEGGLLRFSVKQADWSTPATIPGTVGGEPSLASGGGNTFHLTWAAYNELNGFFDVYYSRYQNAAWSLPENVSDIGEDSLQPDIAVAADGRRLIVWSQLSGSEYKLFGASAGPSGDWSTGPLESLAGEAPAVAATQDGWWVAWSDALEPDGPTDVFAMQRTADGWQLPEMISPEGPEDDTAPDIAAASSATAAIVWRRGGTAIAGAFRDEAGWTAPMTLSTNELGIGDPAVASSTAGFGAAWATFDVVEGAMGAGSAWSPAVALHTFEEAFGAAVAMQSGQVEVVTAARPPLMEDQDIWWLSFGAEDVPTPTPSATPTATQTATATQTSEVPPSPTATATPSATATGANGERRIFLPWSETP